MKNFLSLCLILSFLIQNVAFARSSAQSLPAEQAFKETYIALMKGKDPVTVYQGLAKRLQKTGLKMEDVLDAAVRKEWMSKKEADAAVSVARKYASDRSFVEDLKVKGVSKDVVRTLTKAFQSQVTGAECGHCGNLEGYWVGYVVLSALSSLIVIGIIVAVATAG